jgi:hypothetical protein
MQYILASEDFLEISFRKGMQYIIPRAARTTNHVQSGNDHIMNHLPSYCLQAGVCSPSSVVSWT